MADWISEALEISYLRLIRQSSDDNRVQKKKHDGDQKLLSLSNQAQFLLINKATVRWLSNKIHDPLFTDDIESLTDRFRGNIIIDMESELAERDWNKLIIGNHEFRVSTFEILNVFRVAHELITPCFNIFLVISGGRTLPKMPDGMHQSTHRRKDSRTSSDYI